MTFWSCLVENRSIKGTFLRWRAFTDLLFVDHSISADDCRVRLASDKLIGAELEMKTWRQAGNNREGTAQAYCGYVTIFNSNFMFQFQIEIECWIKIGNLNWIDGLLQRRGGSWYRGDVRRNKIRRPDQPPFLIRNQRFIFQFSNNAFSPFLSVSKRFNC